jgi:hypothetical protein
MSHIPPIDTRMSQGDQNFIKYVIPLIQDHFPGTWISTNGAPCDYVHGVDFIHVNGHQVQTISARVWKSMCHSNFTARWYRTSDPSRKLEYTSKMEAHQAGTYMTDWTIEAFISRSGVSVCAVPTKVLYQYLESLGDLALVFIVQNRNDSVYFKKVPWLEVHDDTIKWFTTWGP